MLNSELDSLLWLRHTKQTIESCTRDFHLYNKLNNFNRLHVRILN